jgi:hypothetical protein
MAEGGSFHIEATAGQKQVKPETDNVSADTLAARFPIMAAMGKTLCSDRGLE